MTESVFQPEWSPDGNEIRAERTPSERAVHHAERKALYLKLHPETKHGGAPGKAGGGKKAKDAKLASFVKDTAKKTGKAKRTIARDVSRGEKGANSQWSIPMSTPYERRATEIGAAQNARRSG